LLYKNDEQRLNDSNYFNIFTLNDFAYLEILLDASLKIVLWNYQNYVE